MKGAASLQDCPEPDWFTALDEYTPPQHCKRGEIIEGVIVSVDAKALLVDVGGKCDAIVHPHEVELMTAQQLQALKPGQSIRVYVLDAAEQNNMIVVSLAKASQQSDWEQAQALLESGEPVELEVIDTNKGGVIVHMGRLRGFVPGSQLLPNWRTLQNAESPEERWGSLLGKSLKLKVIEVTPDRNRLILSEKTGSERKPKKREILAEIEVGKKYKGTVSNLVEFGAFVNIRGIDGLLHISELSWQRVNHPSEVLEVGQKIEVCVLDIDLERERLSLSLKRLQEDPWESVQGLYHEGQLVEVEIVNLTSFGAFASPVDHPEIEGLIHISELQERPIVHPEEAVQVGTRCIARVISLRSDVRRIAFSLKQVHGGESPETEDWQEALAAAQTEQEPVSPVE